MSLSSDINLLADLAYLTASRGELWLVHGSSTPPLPPANGLPVKTASLEKCLADPTTLAPAHGILVTLPSDDVALAREMAGKLRPVAHGPFLVRILSGSAGTRESWDSVFIAAGWRRHPLVLLRIRFNELEEAADCLLAYLPLSAGELESFPGSFLATERNLHMDMLREAGRRSDAHLVRYVWAAGFLRPNDVVLDAACGMGYGSAILRLGSRCRQVLGLDQSPRAVEYAQTAYGTMASGLEFRRTHLPNLEFIADDSLDCLVSFETLEHLAAPAIFLAEVLRILKPGGRFLCSVPNCWADDSGRDPSPHHLQTFDLSSLLKLCGGLRLDQLIGQCAGGGDPRFSATRRMEIFDTAPLPDDRRAKGVEWWLLSAIKDPVAHGDRPYRETVFPALQSPQAGSPGYAQGYANPWLVHSMVHPPFRLRSQQALAQLACEVLATYRSGTADHGAALAILLYQAIEGGKAKEIDGLEIKTRDHLQHRPAAPHEHRWQISLRFALAQWLLARGKTEAAQDNFLVCAGHNFADFAPHIATKTTEAALLAGRLALLAGNSDGAQKAWERGLEIGRSLAGVPLDHVLIDPKHPHLWGTGDGMREYVLALDNVSRCANGLHLLADFRLNGVGRLTDIEKSWQEADAITRELSAALQLQANLVHKQNGYIAEIEKERDRLSAAATQHESTRQELQQHIDALTAQLELAATGHQKAIDALTAQLQRTVSGSQQIIDGLKGQLDRTVAANEEIVGRYETHLNALKSQLEQLAGTNREQSDLIANLQKEHDRLAQLAESQDKDITHYVKVINEQTAYIKHLESQRPGKQT